MYTEDAEALARRVAETRAALSRLELDLRDLERRLVATTQPLRQEPAEEYYLLPVGAG